MRQIFSLRSWLIVTLLFGLSFSASVREGYAAMPMAFSLTSPEDGKEVSTKTGLDWEDSVVPEGLTYTIQLSKDNNSFSGTGLTEIKSVANSAYFLKEANGIENNRTYYWKVIAVSKITNERRESSQVRYFKTNNSQSTAAWVEGYIYNSQQNSVSGATLTFKGDGIIPVTVTTDLNGYFLAQLLPAVPANPGDPQPIDVAVVADGYVSENTTVTVILGELKEDQTITLNILPGDMDGDLKLTLKDAVLLLQLLTGEPISEINRESALNSEKKPGLADLIYILTDLLK